MSFDNTYKVWTEVKHDIKDLIKRQDVLKRVEVIEERRMQFKIYSEMYILYAELINKLTTVYMETLQVQKRQVVRKLLHAALNRYMELKNSLKDIEMHEYLYLDKILIRKRLCPSDVMIWRSPNFLFRRPPDLQNLLYDYKIFATPEQQEEINAKEKMIQREALILLQSHIRARKARVYQNLIRRDPSKLVVKNRAINYQYTFNERTPTSVPVKRTVYSEDYYKKDEECILEFQKDTVIDKEEINEDELRQQRENAAVLIQKLWRAYAARRLLKKKRVDQEYLLSAKLKLPRRNPRLHQQEVMRMYHLELEKQRLDEEFRQLIEDERTRIYQERAPWIMEDISDHIRAWFLEFYERGNVLHPYPTEVKGGTVLVLKDETMNYEEFAEYILMMDKSKDEKKKKAEKLKQEKLKMKAKAKKEKLKLKKTLMKYKKLGWVPIGHEVTTNKYIKQMEDTIQQYSIDWRFVDEYLNKSHDPIKEWVTEDVLAKAHVDLRLLVDEYMRTEWELLQQAWCLDEKRKYKPSKNKKPKEKKKKGKKKPKDPTGDRTLESLYMELKNDGFIAQLPHRRFEDFIGEFNFLANDTRDINDLTTKGPTMQDVKMLVEECIIGMGDIDVARPKSLLFIGPRQSGKKLLCNIMASELDALVINLSPERTARLNPAELNYFIHVVMKVARAFQPTLLYIEEAHRVLWKKVPPEAEHLNPQILSTIIQKKIVKAIKKEDRIMLVATSDEPWSAKGAFKRLFQKVILIPKIDYGSSFLMWLNLLEDNVPSQIEDYELSVLTKCMQKYTTGKVVENVHDTLTVGRKAMLNLKPLHPSEFLEQFLDHKEPVLPIDEKILAKYEKYYNGANKLAKQRSKFYKALLAKQKKK